MKFTLSTKNSAKNLDKSTITFKPKFIKDKLKKQTTFKDGVVPFTAKLVENFLMRWKDGAIIDPTQSVKQQIQMPVLMIFGEQAYLKVVVPTLVSKANKSGMFK